jgi:creatinine amidohydrolase
MKRFFATLPFFCSLEPVCASLSAQPPTRPAVRTAPAGKVLAIGSLTYTEIDALDRNRTIFLLPIGILEEHGPHLAISADLVGVDYEAGQVAKRVSRALADWNIVMMPTISYGSSGANQMNGFPIHPGTYPIRQSTLRSMVADIGAQIAQNRFKWIFVMNGHGAPAHHVAVNDASDFVSEAFNVTMLNISALFTEDSAMRAEGTRISERHFSSAELSSIGLDRHAGTAETSVMIALRPDLVRRSYRTLPSYRAGSVSEMRAVAQKPGWQGYWSSPARATAAYGRELEAWWVDGMTDIVLRAVRGENMFQRPRFPTSLFADTALVHLVEGYAAREQEFEQRLERWLSQRKKSR